MANFCELCAKQTIAGRRIRHHHSIGWKYRAPRKTRVFKPNLRPAKLFIDDNTRPVTMTVCMKCYKKLRKDSAPVVAEAKVEA